MKGTGERKKKGKRGNYIIMFNFNFICVLGRGPLGQWHMGLNGSRVAVFGRRVEPGDGRQPARQGAAASE